MNSMEMHLEMLFGYCELLTDRRRPRQKSAHANFNFQKCFDRRVRQPLWFRRSATCHKVFLVATHAGKIIKDVVAKIATTSVEIYVY